MIVNGLIKLLELIAFKKFVKYLRLIIKTETIKEVELK